MSQYPRVSRICVDTHEYQDYVQPPTIMTYSSASPTRWSNASTTGWEPRFPYAVERRLHYKVEPRFHCNSHQRWNCATHNGGIALPTAVELHSQRW